MTDITEYNQITRDNEFGKCGLCDEGWRLYEHKDTKNRTHAVVEQDGRVSYHPCESEE